MSNTLASGRISTFETRSRGELTDGSGVVPGGDPASSVGECRMNTGEPGIGLILLIRFPPRRGLLTSGKTDRTEKT